MKHLLLVVISLVLLACEQNNANKNVLKETKESAKINSITIDTFSVFPPEIDGCSCYFSNDSNQFKTGQFIYVNDFSSVSFLKINGVITKFTQTYFKKVNENKTIAKAKSSQFELILEINDGIQNGDETMLKVGIIKLIDKKGKTITKTFYGECGC